MTLNRRQASGLLASLAFPGLAQAQSFPSRPIRLLVGAAPGGPSDFLARLLAEGLTAQFNQSCVVENKPGASGTFAADAVAKAAPDGHTLLISGPSAVVNAPHVFARLTYNPVRDLVPLGVAGAGAFVLAVGPEVKARTVADLVALAKAKPGALNYGSGGKGSSGHLATEFFGQVSGAQMTHVPYKGDGLAMNDLLGNQIQVLFTAPNVAMAHARAGRLKILAVTSRERLTALPDVPTMIESGFADFEFLGWIMGFAPAATPPDTLRALQGAWTKATQQEAMRRKLDDLGMRAPDRLSDAAVVTSFLRDEHARMARIVNAAGIKPE